ncbi:hypothetical protein ACSBR2_008940 [Camellia fascicularis]
MSPLCKVPIAAFHFCNMSHTYACRTHLKLVRISTLINKVKRSLIQRRISCTRTREEGVDDPYSHPPKGVCLDDWKHMIDVAWNDESHLKRSKAGTANRSLLPYNHTSGSLSFPIAMSLMADENGELDFPEFYSKSHKSKKTNEWIDPKCDAMVNLQATDTDAGIPLTQEKLSRQVLGQRKNYLCGFGIGP